MNLKIAIVGPGAIGTLIAYSVYKAGYTPTLIARDTTIRDHIKLRGCSIVRSGVEYRFDANIISWHDRLDRYDIIFVAVKAYDVDNAIRGLKSITHEDSIVISCQNGIGSLEAIESIVGRGRSAAAVISYGAIKLDYGRSELKGIGEIILGSRAGLSSKIYKLRDILSRGGLNIKLSSNIDGFRWVKTLINAGINPVTAIFNAPNKVILDIPEAREIAEDAVSEGLKIASKLNIELPCDPIREMYRIAGLTAENYSSMLQDLLHYKPTEIDYINGAIVRFGRKLNIPTPINQFLIKAVKGLVRWRRKSL